MNPLRDLFWLQVDRRIGPKPSEKRRVKGQLMKIRYRDKNTFTNWLTKPLSERPDIRLSDLEDVAAALQVLPTELISSELTSMPASDLQLELPFPREAGHLSLELETTNSALKVRISRSS
jgi:hypothetical protein